MTDTFVDPRVGAPTAPAPVSVDRQPGDTLKRTVLAELDAEVVKPDITLPVRTRAGYAVVYGTKLDADLLDGWVKSATTAKGLDQFQLSLLTLAGHCKAILRNGEPVVIDGQPATFSTLQDGLGCIDVTSTVRKFYGDDALVGATYTALLEACGSGEKVDPTNGSAG